MSLELPPVITNVAISPVSGPGGTRFAAEVTLTEVPASRIAYQWRLDWADIPGATGASHIGTQAGRLTVLASVTNAHGTDSRESAPASVSPGLELPAVVEIGVVPEAGTVGNRFTVTTVATGVPLPSLSYQWLLDGRAICGATGPSHVARCTGQLAVRIIARNSEGTDSRISTAVAVGTNGTAPQIANIRINPETGRAGETFSVSAEVTGSPEPRLMYQWYLDGAAIADATAQSYVPTGTGLLSVRVRARNEAGHACLDSEAIQVEPEFSLPQVRAADILPNSGRVGDTFSVKTTVFGYPEPDLRYEWFLNDVSIPEVTGEVYTSNRQGTLYVRITATSSLGGDMRESGAVLIEPPLSPPALIDATVTPETGHIGDTFDVVALAAGNPVPEIAYQWVLDGVDIEGATEPRYLADRSGLLHVRVSARNSLGEATIESRQVTVGSGLAAPAITAIAIAPQSGYVGEAFRLAIEATGEPVPALACEWLLDGALIDGATETTYVAAQAGLLSARVTATNTQGADLREAASVRVLPALAAPEIIAAEIRPGEGRVGDTFSLAATVTGNPAPELRCQWLLDGEEIGGANGDSLVASVAGRLTAMVTATSSEGTAHLATEAATVLASETLQVFEPGVFEEGVFL